MLPQTCFPERSTSQGDVEFKFFDLIFNQKTNKYMNKTHVNYHFIIKFMRFSFWQLLILIFSLSVSFAGNNHVSAQPPLDKLITVSFNETPIKEALNIIKEKSGVDFVFSTSSLDLSEKVTLYLTNSTLGEVLDLMLEPLSLQYIIKGKTHIIIRKSDWNQDVSLAKIEPLKEEQIQTNKQRITGIVKDQDGAPMMLVNVLIKNKAKGTLTKEDGSFIIETDSRDTLIFSFIGYTSVIEPVNGKSIINIVLNQSQLQIESVIVTGIYTRSKESFTGSATTYTKDDLKKVGTSNVLQSLKTIDPSFAILENAQFGSDPNRLPNMEIRGKSSMLGLRDNISADPNQPLFILDGFESSLSVINDLDINRIESITILKDAASTAIYGSKAANGVIVVETVKPKAGKLQVSYNGNSNVSLPDLTSYNLMNAKEKIDFELLAGKYDASKIETPYRTATDVRLTEMYYKRLKSIAEGVDTYWLAEPLRIGVNQKHSLYVMGGEGNFMFGLGGGYNGITGAMKKSDRDVINGNIDLIYRVSKFQFTNKLSINSTSYSNPIVAFSEYANANPFYRKRNNDGQVEQWLEYNDVSKISNPLWNASLNSRNIGNNIGISNFFVAEWNPVREWKVRARFGLTLSNSETEKFTSPEDNNQILNKITTKRGEFSTTNSKGTQYEGEISVTYAKILKKHRINLVAGSNIFSSDNLVQGYSVEGFPAGDFTYPSFASGYPENGKPTYLESVSRSVNGYFNSGYSFDERYLLDLSLRTSGSSIFGSTRKFNTTWSVGIGWNLHREKFIVDNAEWIDNFKLRASMGNPGNQSFDSGKTLLTYAFQYGMLNYFGLGALPDQIGNQNLEWQITNDKNIGLDLTILNRRLSLTVDYYHKVTNPLLISIGMPLSSGSSVFFTNAGKQTSQGLTFSTLFRIIHDTERRILWSVRANGRTQSSLIDGIGNKLDVFNNSNRGTSTTRYYDGSDPDNIWLIRSAGIDPSTGKELFFTKEGGFTYDFSYNNEVICGNSRPDLEGVIGTSITIKGFTASLNFRYQFGADVFNYAIRNKVENINMDFNQDRRALYERWQSVGDIKRYKNIADMNTSPMSSRFLQKEKSFSLESLHLEYELIGESIKKLGLGNLKIFLSMRDVFRMSSIKAERGIDYPFARVFDAGLSLNF